MTVATELAREGQRLEYFLSVEGAGWPTNGLGGALSGGFDGVVWTTNDFAGTLATTLGCAVYHGLSLPESISESVDPRTCVYSPSGLSVTIQDHDDWWLANLKPRAQGTDTTIYDDGSGVGLHYKDRNVKLTDGTAFSEGDLIWIGGRELVLLGPKIAIAGDAYRFYPSTRGYLGTQRGSALRRPEDYCLGHWPVGASVTDVARYWFGRRAALWAHVPGEAVANCALIWFGRLRDLTNPDAGLEWNLSFSGDFMSAAGRIHRAADWRVACRGWDDGIGLSASQLDLESAARKGRRSCLFNRSAIARFGSDGRGLYELPAAYQYRSEPGGTQGMVSSWDNAMSAGTAAQALDVTTGTRTDVDVLRSFVMIDDAVFFMHNATPSASGGRGANDVLADIIPYAGADPLANVSRAASGSIANTPLTYADATRARFLLSNYGDDRATSRFCVNGQPTRNVVDTLLIFMLSSDREYYRVDTGAGSTATVIQFADTGADDDEWIDKALFCVEGTYKWQARPITDNDGTSITVEDGFTGAPPAGVEMQVRNSIYDVLPVGWGLGIPSEDVDVESFERVRDEYLSNANVGEFMLGTEDETDIWKMLLEGICQPYGILVYFDYETRKISARYIGQVAESGTFETYTAIGRGDIIEPGDVRHTIANPIGAIRLRVRSVRERVVGVEYGTSTNAHGTGLGTVLVPKLRRVPSLMGGDTTEIVIRSEEVGYAFSEAELDSLTVDALLNTEDDFALLAGRLVGLVSEYSVQPPTWTPTLDVSLYQSCKPGALVTIDWNTPDAPANPYTGTRGWSALVGRVLERGFFLDGGKLGFSASIEILAAQTIGRVAPAAKVTGKNSDANGAYFTVEDTNFVADQTSDKDWFYFAVGDRLDHRTADGATAAAWAVRAITGFGSNFASTPQGAADSRIYVDGAIGSAITAGDYITFASWSASNTARMELYSAYATAAGALTGGDSAKRYGG